MDVLFGETELNRPDSSLSPFIADSMYVPYSSKVSSCASSSVFPSNCWDCLPSNRQQSLLNDASSTSSVIPFVFQKVPSSFGTCLPSETECHFSAEVDILRSQNQWNLDTQNDVKSRKSPVSNIDSVPVQYSLGKEVFTRPSFESLTSLVTASAAALPSKAVFPLLDSVPATPISIASPRSSVVPSRSPVAPLLLASQFSPNTGTRLTTANPATGTDPLTRTDLLLYTIANQETGTRSSLLTAANQEKGTGSSVLTTTNQEIGTRSTKTDRKPAKIELYKTELCRAFSEKGSCGYGDKCQFAHGEREQRAIFRNAKYKTKRCWTYHSTGFCYYGARCNFIHDEDRSGRSWGHPSDQGEDSTARFEARLDSMGGVSSDPSLGLAVDWDARLEAISDPDLEVILDLVGLSLNPRVERDLKASIGPRVAPSLKPVISHNSLPKDGQNANPNTWQISDGMISISNITVPISCGTVPISYGTVPISYGTVPISYGTVPISYRTVPVSYGMVPISTGMVRSSPPVTTDFSGVTLEDTLAHGLSDHPPPQLLPAATTQAGSTSMHHPDSYSWDKQKGLLGVSSNQSCTEKSSSLSHGASVASNSNIWSSLIKHPRCWTLS